MMNKKFYIIFAILAVIALCYSLYAKSKLEDQLAVSGKCEDGLVVETSGSLKRPNATIQYVVKGKVFEVTLRSRADVDDVVLIKYDTLNPEEVLIVDKCE